MKIAKLRIGVEDRVDEMKVWESRKGGKKGELKVWERDLVR